MQTQQALGLVCQSCGMPLTKPEDFGTDAGGFRNNDYCHFCFADGRFTQLDATLEGMIDRCVDVLATRGMPRSQAQAMMEDVIPKLMRWRARAAKRPKAVAGVP